MIATRIFKQSAAATVLFTVLSGQAYASCNSGCDGADLTQNLMDNSTQTLTGGDVNGEVTGTVTGSVDGQITGSIDNVVETDISVTPQINTDITSNPIANGGNGGNGTATSDSTLEIKDGAIQANGGTGTGTADAKSDASATNGDQIITTNNNRTTKIGSATNMVPAITQRAVDSCTSSYGFGVGAGDVMGQYAGISFSKSGGAAQVTIYREEEVERANKAYKKLVDNGTEYELSDDGNVITVANQTIQRINVSEQETAVFAEYNEYLANNGGGKEYQLSEDGNTITLDGREIVKAVIFEEENPDFAEYAENITSGTEYPETEDGKSIIIDGNEIAKTVVINQPNLEFNNIIESDTFYRLSEDGKSIIVDGLKIEKTLTVKEDNPEFTKIIEDKNSYRQSADGESIIVNDEEIAKTVMETDKYIHTVPEFAVMKPLDRGLFYDGMSGGDVEMATCLAGKFQELKLEYDKALGVAKIIADAEVKISRISGKANVAIQAVHEFGQTDRAQITIDGEIAVIVTKHECNAGGVMEKNSDGSTKINPQTLAYNINGTADEHGECTKRGNTAHKNASRQRVNDYTRFVPNF